MRPPRQVIVAAALFATAGLLHFIVPGFFERIVPAWVPDARLAVLASGVAELAGAVGLLFVRTRTAAAYGLIALMVSVFPANIEMLRQARASGAPLPAELTLWARLPLQALLIWWLWRIRRSDDG